MAEQPCGNLEVVATSQTVHLGNREIPRERFLLLRRCLAGSVLLTLCALSIPMVAVVSVGAVEVLGGVAFFAGCWSLSWLQRLMRHCFAELESSS